MTNNSQDEIKQLHRIADELMKYWKMEIEADPDSINVDTFYTLSNEIKDIANRLNDFDNSNQSEENKDCPHKDFAQKEIEGEDYYYSLIECKDCGKSWLE